MQYTVKDDAPSLEVEIKVRASRSKQTSYVYVNLWKLDVGWSSRVYTVQYRTLEPVLWIQITTGLQR
jgi:hypothetical protein